MLIKTPAELIRRLNELRQNNPAAYAHVRIIKPKSAGQDSSEDTQPLPGDQDDD